MSFTSILDDKNRTLQRDANRQGAVTTIPYIRPAAWLTLPDATASEMFVGLYLIGPDSNFVAVQASGAYTVDWGDGSVINYSSGAVAEKTYTYSSIPDTGENILGYRQVIITITPQAGQNIRNLNIGLRHSTISAYNSWYSNQWLDIVINLPYVTSLTIKPVDTSVYGITSHLLQSVVIYNHALTSMYQLFYGCRSLVNVNINSTTSVTNMGLMFYNCSSLKVAPHMDTSNVGLMNSMFAGCRSLLATPTYNTASCYSMNSMFYECYSLDKIPLYNTTNVSDMASMFQGCVALTSVPLLDTANVTDMTQMFSGALKLEQIPRFNTSNVTSMLYTFNNTGLTSVPNLDTSNVTNMSAAFFGTKITVGPDINTQNVTNMGSMFGNCRRLRSVPAYDTSNVTDMSYMFQECNSLEEGPDFNTSNVTNMSAMFYSCNSLKRIPQYNTSNVTNMSTMFYRCFSLATIPLLDTSKCTNISSMFFETSGLSHIPLLNAARVTASINFWETYSLCSAALYRPRVNISFNSFYYYGYKLSAAELNKIYTNLAALGTKTLSGASGDGATITYTAATTHNYLEGQLVSVTGFSPSGFNVADVVITSVISSTQFTVAGSETGTATGTGTADGGPASNINVSKNYGALADNPTIAIDKGWTVSG